MHCGWCGGRDYDETVSFYRDTIGLPVLETFRDSYGLDGTIMGLPGGLVHLRSSGWRTGRTRRADWISWCLPADAAAQERIMARLAVAGAHPVEQIDYWQENGGVTYQDSTGERWCCFLGL